MLHLVAKLKDRALNVGYLASGVAFAQLLNFITLFYLARHSSADTISLLALVTANLSGLSPLVSLRFDIAIVVANDDHDRRGLLVISVAFSALVAAALFVTYICGAIPPDLGGDTGGLTILLFATALLLNNLMSLGAAILNSKAAYRLMSIIVVAQAFAYLVSVVFFVEWANLHAAVLALAMSYLLAACAYIYNCKEFFSERYSFVDAAQVLKKYSLYPLVSMPMAVLNGYYHALPILFLSGYFDSAEVAIFFLVQRYIGSPLGIISTSIYNVAIKEFSTMSSKSRLRSFLYYTAVLSVVASFTYVVLALIPAAVYTALFQTTDEIKEVVLILALSIIAKFVISPLTCVLPALGKVGYEALWKLPAFLILLLYLLFFVNKIDFKTFILQLVIIDVVLYLLYWIMCAYTAAAANR